VFYAEGPAVLTLL